MASESQDNQYAKLALSLMEKHGVSPNPENFSVWFQYGMGTNKELVYEIDNALARGLSFTREACATLYNRFTMPTGRHQKTIDEATHNAQRVLAEMLSMAAGLSGETQTYNQSLDQYMEQISRDLEGGDVKSFFKNLVNATASIKHSGENIHQKLEESTQEIATLRKNLEQVTTESQRDFLTGVYNRKAFEKMYEDQRVLAKENGYDICLLMLDIDHFKQFNDKFGHLLGDEVLKIVSRALMSTLKGRDIVARFGGEEFVVMLPETPIESAMRVAELIRGNIANKELKQKNTGENYGSITVSIGVSRMSTGEDDSLESLIKRADDALYKSKRNGRNQVTQEG